jgi:UDP-galactopyranose mutase
VPDSYDYVIVGAGFAGLVLAERLSSAGHRCLVVERRSHIGGNCFDRKDKNGLLYHAYGPHYFRTNSEAVRTYLSRFTEWREVSYKVQVYARNRYWSFPVNLNTFRQLKSNPRATEAEFQAYLCEHRLKIENPANSEEAVLATVGEELYELFFRGYTEKQWGRSARQLDASVCRRIPVRTNEDDRYFSDAFQALPSQGYTAMFENLIGSMRAEVRLGTDYREILPHLRYKHLIYTGPLDEYFGCKWGRLPYRSLNFQLEEFGADKNPHGYVQPALQINYPGSEPFTRTVELKHITGQQSSCTNVVREFPAEYRPGSSEPYYPVPGPETQALAERYRDLAAREKNVTFLGRLATYRYLNMDQVVAAALQTFENLQAGRSSPATEVRRKRLLRRKPPTAALAG